MINDGLTWFFVASYRYICPRGVIDHMKFAMRLPRATLIYMWSRYKRIGEQCPVCGCEDIRGGHYCIG